MSRGCVLRTVHVLSESRARISPCTVAPRLLCMSYLPSFFFHFFCLFTSLSRCKQGQTSAVDLVNSMHFREGENQRIRKKKTSYFPTRLRRVSVAPATVSNALEKLKPGSRRSAMSDDHLPTLIQPHALSARFPKEDSPPETRGLQGDLAKKGGVANSHGPQHPAQATNCKQPRNASKARYRARERLAE